MTIFIRHLDQQSIKEHLTGSNFARQVRHISIGLLNNWFARLEFTCTYSTVQCTLTKVSTGSHDRWYLLMFLKECFRFICLNKSYHIYRAHATERFGQNSCPGITHFALRWHQMLSEVTSHFQTSLIMKKQNKTKKPEAYMYLWIFLFHNWTVNSPFQRNIS